MSSISGEGERPATEEARLREMIRRELRELLLSDTEVRRSLLSELERELAVRLRTRAPGGGFLEYKGRAVSAPTNQELPAWAMKTEPGGGEEQGRG